MDTASEGLLELVDKSNIKASKRAAIFKYYSEFYGCPVILTDQLNNILMVNKAAAGFLGASGEELSGCSFNILLSKLVDVTEQERKIDLLENMGYYDGYTVLRSSDGKEHFVKVNINRIPVGHNEYCLVHELFLSNQKKLDEYKDFVKVKNEIYYNVGRIGNIRQLAQRINIDYRRILYLFKQFESSTPKQYLTSMKIKKCIELIKKGNFNYKEIAYELGYCDVSHLCNSFKEKMKKTLMEYKREVLLIRN